MIFVAVLMIPAIVLACAYALAGHKITKEEAVAQTAIPVVICLIVYFACTASITWDYEIWGHYVKSATHEEPWNEYIHQTCTRTVSCGKDCTTTETYDCSYVEYHPECWWVRLNTGDRVSISQSHYQTLVNRFGNQAKTGHNSGYTQSGDIFSTNFNGKFEDIEAYTSTHSWTNKVQASRSVFKFQDVSEEEAKNSGLYEVNLENGFAVSSVYGGRSKVIDNLNAKYGSQYQVRVVVLIYNNKPMETFSLQESYWLGGNKNELVLGIGTSNGKVVWGDTFSWCENYDFMISCRNQIEKQIDKPLDLDKIGEWLRQEIPRGWRRKEFGDFEYLEVEYPTWVNTTVMSISIILSVVICGLCLTIDDWENLGNRTRRFKYRRRY